MAANAPLVMRIAAASVAVANRASQIIRDVMKKGELGIVEKVNSLLLCMFNDEVNWNWIKMGSKIKSTVVIKSCPDMSVIGYELMTNH